MALPPSVHITFTLSSNRHKRSAPENEKPYLVVTTTLAGIPNLVLETRGEWDSGTVLVHGFRAEHFELYDLTTSEPVIHSPFPGTCEPRESVRLDGVVELSSEKYSMTSLRLEDISPHSDPVRQLEVGHKYRIRLNTQKIPGYAMTQTEFFGGRRSVPVEDLPEGYQIELSSEDEVVLEIEA